MGIVISDASCLILFTNIDRLDILSILFGEIWVTSAVKSEYKLELPVFITVRDPADSELLDTLRQQLDPGEASAIALAAQTSDSTLLIDEKKGRRIATAMGLEVTGTVGILLEAFDRRLITPNPQLAALMDAQGFHLSTRLKKLLSDSE